MTALLIGDARCSTDQQDLTAQRDALAALGVVPARIYVDHGLTGTNRDRPGLREAMAACREGNTLVVAKLDRLARSLPDARAIADDRTARQVKLNIGGSVYDPTDAVARLLFNVLAMIAEFESDLIRLRTREGMKVAKAKGRLRVSSPSSNRVRKPIWSPCSNPGNTTPQSSQTCLRSAGPPCIEQNNATSPPPDCDPPGCPAVAAGRPRSGGRTAGSCVVGRSTNGRWPHQECSLQAHAER